jgi:type I restriction enzyme, S subunit
LRMGKTEKLVPKLRFLGFEGEWEETKYGKIYSFHTTNSLSRDKLNYDSGKVKNIHYGDIHTKFAALFDVKKEEVPYVNLDVDLSKIKHDCYCQVGDLVVADASEDYLDIGKTIEIVELNNEKLIAGLHTFLARPVKGKMAKGFGGYLVQSWSYRRQIMTIAQGTKVLSLATGRLAEVEINFPTLPEQEKIAGFLSSVDTKLQQLREKKDLLTQYKKGLMQQLFSGALRFKDDQGKDFPDWEEKRLGEVAEKVSTKNRANTVAFVLTNSATQGIVSQGDYFDRDIANQSNLEGYYIVSVDDFVYNPRISVHAPVGPIKRNKLREGVMSPLYLVFRFNVKQLAYFEYYFETTRWHLYLESVANVGARHDRMNIANKDFFAMPLLIPSEAEREKIATFLSALDQKIETLATTIAGLTEWKKGLLQGLFV